MLLVQLLFAKNIVQFVHSDCRIHSVRILSWEKRLNFGSLGWVKRLDSGTRFRLTVVLILSYSLSSLEMDMENF